MKPGLAAGQADDTIFAPATGAGRSAISILRLTGTGSAALVKRLAGRLPEPRRASVSRLRDGDGDVLDQAMVLWLPGPGSYTGEDMAEFHLHGGHAVQIAVMEALVEYGARPAEAGEFTRRAVMGGKMDLLSAEAIGDLVDAETQAQRKLALRQLSGEQGRFARDLIGQLTHSLAWQEALIDFPDDDLPAEAEQEMLDRVAGLLATVRACIASTECGERLRRGLVFAITGAPNVGKSSLLNALAGREAAIVSARPGTTRDTIHIDLVLDGIPVTIVDTAGQRETVDPIEIEGIRRAIAQAAAADYVMVLTDGLTSHALPLQGNSRHIVIANKIDLVAAPAGVLGVSALTKSGLPALLDHLTAVAAELADPGSLALLTRPRHKAALIDAERCLDLALVCSFAELRAEHLRMAVDAVGRIAGAVACDAVLDAVFGSFCIGK